MLFHDVQHWVVAVENLKFRGTPIKTCFDCVRCSVAIYIQDVALGFGYSLFS